METALYIIGGYIWGSVLYAEFFMKLIYGKSLMVVSKNHNPGVSNAYIYGGVLCGTLALAGDLLKGIVPVMLYCKCVGNSSVELSMVMVAPVLGHAFSCFKKFRGGMSITVSFGVLAGLLPEYLPLSILIILYLLLLLIPGLGNSVRSIFAYTGLTLLSFVFEIIGFLEKDIVAGICIISMIVLYKMWPDLTNEDRNKIRRVLYF